MEEKTVSFIAYEAVLARMERIIKRLWISNIAVLALLVLSNGSWLIFRRRLSDER